MGKRYVCTDHNRLGSYCQECFEKQLKIDRLEEQVKSLEAKLKYREKKAAFPFGSSTPSSKIFTKPNSQVSDQKKQGGAKKGHKGNAGRHTFDSAEADEVIELSVEDSICSDCGGNLEEKSTDERCVIDAEVMKAIRVLYRCQTKRCQKCRCEKSRKPLVLPQSKYGNGLISNSAVMHYLEGVPLNKIEKMWGKDVVKGNLNKIFQKVAKKLEPLSEQFLEELRQKPVFHADETSWRTNGHSGYCWLFCSDEISIFRFENTRAATVVQQSLGQSPLPGVLVVDRYAAYNKAPCKIQYCFEHLKRKLKDLETEFSQEQEVKYFVKILLPKLQEAMKLRNKEISDEQYYQRAKALKEEILEIIHSEAQHLGIQAYQDVFRDNEQRLYHWVQDRRVPAENNKAERELRPTVIARKVSFGSQSEQGAKTRSVMMTVLHTVAKRLQEKTIRQWFIQLLETIAADPDADLSLLIPEPP